MTTPADDITPEEIAAWKASGARGHAGDGTDRATARLREESNAAVKKLGLSVICGPKDLAEMATGYKVERDQARADLAAAKATIATAWEASGIPPTARCETLAEIVEHLVRSNSGLRDDIAALTEERDAALAEADRRAADSLLELDEAHKRISAITTEEQKWRDSFFTAIAKRDTMRLALSSIENDICDEPFHGLEAPCGCCRSHIKTARRALDE